MFRIGNGYDVHRLVEGRKLILGGVEIPFEKGLLGHSDADVLCHAISDALLGAADAGDIGKHFPDSADQFKGISSLILLEKVGGVLREKGYEICNLDSIVVAHQPRISPHSQGMKQNISQALKIDESQVSIKATTTEGLGFVGVGEGIASYAVALLAQKNNG